MGGYIMHALLIAAGGFLGAMLRYSVSIFIPEQSFPYATFSINIIGSFFMGLILVYCYKRWATRPGFRLFFAVGLLGSFTTFSTFTLETLNLLNLGHIFDAITYFILSPLLGILAAMLGVKIAWLLLYSHTEKRSDAENG